MHKNYSFSGCIILESSNYRLLFIVIILLHLLSLRWCLRHDDKLIFTTKNWYSYRSISLLLDEFEIIISKEVKREREKKSHIIWCSKLIKEKLFCWLNTWTTKLLSINFVENLYSFSCKNQFTKEIIFILR